MLKISNKWHFVFFENGKGCIIDIENFVHFDKGNKNVDI